VIVEGNTNLIADVVGIATEGVKRMVYSAITPAFVGLKLAESLLKPAPKAKCRSIIAFRMRYTLIILIIFKFKLD
jgi:hypothetical protein